MTAIAKDRVTLWREPDMIDVPVAAGAKIYAGTFVCANATGFAVSAADTAAFVTLGVAAEQADNTTGADGAISVPVRAGKVHRFAAVSITQAMVGDIMYIVDNQTFDDAVGTNSVKAGTLRKFISVTEGEIEVHGGIR
jgi:hypothetical protein